MGITRIAAYPIREFGKAYGRAKELSFYYDIAKRLACAGGLPSSLRINGKKVKTYAAIGRQLMIETEARGVFLQKASLTGLTKNITEAIKASWPKDQPLPPLEKDKLAALRVIIPRTPESAWQRFKRNRYDTFVPIKRTRAFSHIVDQLWTRREAISELEKKVEARGELLKQIQDKVGYLNLGHQAYIEIMNAIYRSGSGKTLMENVNTMFDVVTKWAYRVIGRSPDSEAAGWVVIGPDGKVGVPYRYVVAQKDQPVSEAPIFTLRRPGSARRFSLILKDSQTMIKVADERGRFIAVEEWEAQKLREDLVVVENKDGTRKLYRRNLQPGSQLIKHLIGGKIGEKAGQLAGSFAAAFTDIAAKGAYIELEEVAPDEIDLADGEVIPYVQQGTVIKLISAGSNDPDIREAKIKKGEGVEQACKKGGQPVGIVTQPLEKGLGNVRTAAVMPKVYTIADVDSFKVRPQNEFLIAIVGVKSYFIRSLLEFNQQGEAVCLGCLEVTNPEVIPEKMDEEEARRLTGQFEAGKIFADLVSTGIMIKVLQEEINNLTRSYLGEKVYQLVKARNFEKLRGTKIDDASIMFADVSGFTALSDVLKDNPEQVVYLLSKLFSQLDPIVVKYGGMVDKHDGDCIMADFGVPERVPGDVEASVAAAIEMQRELQKINLQAQMRDMYQEYDLKPLGMTIGINTGTVIAGNLGHEGSKIEYSVIGDAVNQSARLQHAVNRGQILIGQRTYQLLTEIYRRRLLKEFNDYNRDIDKIKQFVLEEYKRQGKTIDEEEIDQALDHYLSAYKDVTEAEMFVPSVIWAKNKGALPSYFVRWDRHAYRYRFLKKAGIQLSDKATFENQPLTTEETNAAIAAEPDQEKRQAMRQVFDELLGKS